MKITSVDFEKVITLEKTEGDISMWQLEYLKEENGEQKLIFKRVNRYMPKLQIGDWVRVEKAPIDCYEGIFIGDVDLELKDDEFILANYSGFFIFKIEKITWIRRSNKELWKRP